MKKLLYLLGFLWLLPMTMLIWTFYILPLLWKDLKFVGWADFLIPHFQVKSKKSWYARMWRDWWGWSGPCVIITADISEDLQGWSLTLIKEIIQTTVKHELRHCKQQFVFGPLHYPLYFLSSVYLWLFRKDKHAYIDNPFEKDARKSAGQTVDIPREQWGKPDDRWPWW